MRRAWWFALGLALVPAAGMAAEPGETVLTPLPSPAAGEDGPVVVFLHDARLAIAAGRTGEAQEALERAQTRRLTRSVDMRRTEVPSEDAVAGDITQARSALAAGDKAAALGRIADALGLLGQN